MITAFHEMGHAMVAHFLENTDPVHKISIISRGQALGYTISLPTEDKFLTTRAELSDSLAMTLGGRAAEELVFSEITTGAANDLEKVTATAKQMVMRFGMSEKLGPRVFGHDQSQPFLGREFSATADYSEEIAREIDDEIRRIVEEAHQTARQVLGDRREALDRLSKLLLEHETIERDEFEALLAGKSKEEVFGAPEPEREPPAAPPVEPARRPVAEPRPLPHPRPGLAGGTAEMRKTRNSLRREFRELRRSAPPSAYRGFRGLPAVSRTCNPGHILGPWRLRPRAPTKKPVPRIGGTSRRATTSPPTCATSTRARSSRWCGRTGAATSAR